VKELPAFRYHGEENYKMLDKSEVCARALAITPKFRRTYFDDYIKMGINFRLFTIPRLLVEPKKPQFRAAAHGDINLITLINGVLTVKVYK